MKQDTGIVDIHGKQYQTVAYRVQQFREKQGTNYGICTTIVDRTEDYVVMRAEILNCDGYVVATGHAEEHRKSSQINRTSALENAETSAIGRALAAFGMGGTEFATADEVANAIHQQAHQPLPRGSANCISEAQGKMLFAKCKAAHVDINSFLAHHNIIRLGELHADLVDAAIEWIEGRPL